MAQVPVHVFILTEEHWGHEDFKQTRIGVYGDRALAQAAANEILESQDKLAIDPENYSFLIEEDVLVAGKNLTKDELIHPSGKAWRWWPQMCQQFVEFEQTA